MADAGHGVGCIDVDHVVLPVASLAVALDQRASWGMIAAPSTRRPWRRCPVTP
jgi:hypothetical protein